MAKAACVMSFSPPPSTLVLSLLTTDNKVADLRTVSIPLRAKVLMRCIQRRSAHWFLWMELMFVRWHYLRRLKQSSVFLRVCLWVCVFDDFRSIAFSYSHTTLCWLIAVVSETVSSRYETSLSQAQSSDQTKLKSFLIILSYTWCCRIMY